MDTNLRSTADISKKEFAIQLINRIPEHKIGYAIAFLQGLDAGEDGWEVPNDLTLAAMEQAVNGEDMHGPFDSVRDLMEALNAED